MKHTGSAPFLLRPTLSIPQAKLCDHCSEISLSRPLVGTEAACIDRQYVGNTNSG